MFAKHTPQHLWGLKGSGDLDIWMCPKRYHFSQDFPESCTCSPQIPLPSALWSSVSTYLSGHLLLSRISDHCSSLCHWSVSTRPESGLVTACPQHLAQSGSSRGIHWRELGPLLNMWPQFTLAKGHLQEADWVPVVAFTPNAYSTGDWHPELLAWHSSDLEEEPLTKFVIWNPWSKQEQWRGSRGPHLVR